MPNIEIISLSIIRLAVASRDNLGNDTESSIDARYGQGKITPELTNMRGKLTLRSFMIPLGQDGQMSF